MKYKMLIFDLDGTALPIGRESIPSEAVIKAVKDAKKKILVAIATGRRITSIVDIFKIFELETPCIIMGGTMIVNPVTKKIIWQKQLEKNTVAEIASIAAKFDGEIIMGDSQIYDRKSNFEINDCSIIYLRNPSKEIADAIAEKLKNIKGINFVYAPSWINGWTDIHITHIDATKKRATEKLTEILGIKKEEVIAVGDSFNDLPLFDAAGLKIAMGNAEVDLKSRADFIAPSVDEDGLVFTINKFVINT